MGFFLGSILFVSDVTRVVLDLIQFHGGQKANNFNLNPETNLIFPIVQPEGKSTVKLGEPLEIQDGGDDDEDSKKKKRKKKKKKEGEDSEEEEEEVLLHNSFDPVHHHHYISKQNNTTTLDNTLQTPEHNT